MRHVTPRDGITKTKLLLLQRGNGVLCKKMRNRTLCELTSKRSHLISDLYLTITMAIQLLVLSKHNYNQTVPHKISNMRATQLNWEPQVSVRASISVIHL